MGRAEINYCVYLTVTGSAIISLRSSLHETPPPQPSLLSALPSYSVPSAPRAIHHRRFGSEQGKGFFRRNAQEVGPNILGLF